MLRGRPSARSESLNEAQEREPEYGPGSEHQEEIDGADASYHAWGSRERDDHRARKDQGPPALRRVHVGVSRFFHWSTFKPRMSSHSINANSARWVTTRNGFDHSVRSDPGKKKA